MNALTIASRLEKIIPGLDSSNFDGERLARINAMERIIKDAGSDWHSVRITVPESQPALHEAEAAELIDRLLRWGRLTGWETQYCLDLAELVRQGKDLSAKQRAKLKEIFQQRRCRT